MVRAFRHGIAAICSLIAISGAVLAEDAPPAQPPWAELSLLEGRLSMQAPASARIVPMTRGIMAPAASQAVQQRVMIDIDAIRIIVVAGDLLLLAGPDFGVAAERIRSQLKASAKVEDLPLDVKPESADGMRIATFTPDRPLPVGDARVVETVLVRHRDESLQLLTFFTNAEGAAAPDRVKALVDRMVRSIALGPRVLPPGGKFVAAGMFELELPAGYVGYGESGADFDVYHVVRLARIGEFRTQLVVYLGGHPQPSSAPDSAQEIASPLFGNEVRWRIWTRTNSVIAETYFRELGKQRLSGHASVVAANPEERDAMMAIVASGKLR